MKMLREVRPLGHDHIAPEFDFSSTKAPKSQAYEKLAGVGDRSKRRVLSAMDSLNALAQRES